MGHRKARIKAFADKASPIAEYMKIYQHALKALLNSLPKEKIQIPGIASVGRVDIWPCQDGAVVLTYRNNSNKIEIFTKDPIGKSVNEFIRFSPECIYYNEKGLEASIPLSVPDASKVIVNLADNRIIGGEHVFLPKYNRAAIIGWDAKLPEPDEAALKDFKSAFLTRLEEKMH